MQTNEQTFKLVTGEDFIFSVYDDKLLFMHSAFTSSQLELNDFGVQLDLHPKQAKLGFLFTKPKLSAQYLSFYFDKSEYKPLQTYFRALGFPVHESIHNFEE